MSAKILAVDDSASLRQAVTIALVAEGFTVAQAADGAEGLAKAAQTDFDVVITDLNMPVMDGMEMIRRLRALPAYSGKPILFLTTESDPVVKAEAKAAGATGWVTKPFEPDRLVAVVRRVLAR